MRKVGNSYVMPFLCFLLKYEANMAACSRVTMTKTMVPFSAVLCFDQLQKIQGNPLPINTLTYEWNISLRSYISIRILEKNCSNTGSLSRNGCLQIDHTTKWVTWKLFTF